MNILKPNHQIHFSGVLYSILLIWLAIDSHHHYGSQLWLVLLITGLTALITFTNFFSLKNNEAFPTFKIIFLWAILFRFIGLFSNPILEDDFYRYLWDGFVFAEYGSPYGQAPASFFADIHLASLWQNILDGINYPDIPTIYAPTLQYFFLICHWLSAGDLLPLKVILIGIDLLIIVLLKTRTKPQYLLLYAWCPLIIKEVAFTAHVDIIGVLFLLLAILAWQRHRYHISGASLAFAVATKPFALLFLPLLIKKPIIGLGSFLLVITTLYLPFIVQGQTELETLLLFAAQWEFNSSFYAIFANLLGQHFAKILCLSIVGVFTCAYWWQFHKYNHNNIPRGDYLFGVFFLMSAVVNPWYVLWLLPFAAIYPSVWIWVASVVVMLAYVTGMNIGDDQLSAYQHPMWIRPLEFGLILIVYIAETLYFKKQAQGSQ